MAVMKFVGRLKAVRRAERPRRKTTLGSIAMIHAFKMIVDSSKLTVEILESQKAPLLSLPIELIQQIASYLNPDTATAFSLSSRYIYYALGTQHLEKYLSVQTCCKKHSIPERRKRIEIVERAFPSHWYCSWCDRFHPQDHSGGPRNYKSETQRDCAEYNSYLHDKHDYVLCYHHIRLGMSRHFWGPDYGLPLSAFEYSAQSQRSLGKRGMTANTHLTCSARIVNDRFLFHSTYVLELPSLFSTRKKTTDMLLLLMPALPQLVTGHRNSHAPHTGMATLLQRPATSNLSSDTVHTCKLCTTDYTVSSSVASANESNAKRTIWIETWRDLGTGRNPFDTLWRAHGEIGQGLEGFSVGRKDGFVGAGAVRRAFESGEERDVKGKRDSGVAFSLDVGRL